jgi:hypothetical protein
VMGEELRTVDDSAIFRCGGRGGRWGSGVCDVCLMHDTHDTTSTGAIDERPKWNGRVSSDGSRRHRTTGVRLAMVRTCTEHTVG